MSRKINIFVIYALADKDIMLRLLRHLNPLNEVFNLSIWHDDPIIPGQPWKTYFESRIHHTDILLLLVSDDFMNSQFIEQVELKAVIDKHKENKSVVIPVIIDNCQWDIDLKVEDYVFNLNELQVLPEEGKPIADWNSADQAYNNVTAGIKKAITPIVDTLKQEESEKDEEKKVADAKEEDHRKISFTEETEVNKLDDEGPSNKEEITTEQEEHRLREEAEAKRRAEVAKRIREQAEASARRREEEDRLWEEALAKRRADKDKGIREEAASVYPVAEEHRLKEEAEAKKRAEKEKKIREKAEEKKRAEEKKKRKKEEEFKRNAVEAAEAATTQRAEQEKNFKAEVKAKRYAEERNRKKLTTEANKEVEEALPENNTKTKKRVLGGSLVALLAIIVIWAFSMVNSGSEKPSTTLPNIKAIDEKDSIGSAKTKIEPPNRVAAFSELEVGDTFEGGIIFTIDQAGKNGKIAYHKDAGLMPWTNAMKIHEQLGDGWRLPTFDELEIMYRTIGQGATNSGQFADELYWSATAFDESQARLLRFRDGNTSYHYNRNVEHRKFQVRAVRGFSQ
ncbi:MAG: TIR domain-containing protein [Eudoraea sp.]|uniref:TIR domain-containing protein n=1 Tax=Eudoraea sp. TaxID=1979955 RepID=UPI0032656931